MRDMERSASDVSLSARPLSAKNKHYRNESGDNSATHLLTMDDSNNQLLLYEGGRNHQQLAVNDTIEDNDNFTTTFENSQLNGATSMRQNLSTSAFSRVETDESV